MSGSDKCHKKSKGRFGDQMETLEPSYTNGENIKQCSYFAKPFVRVFKSFNSYYVNH